MAVNGSEDHPDAPLFEFWLSSGSFARPQEADMKRDEVLEAVRRERSRLLAASSPGDTRNAASDREGWTAKDVLSHCIHWAGQIAFGMGAIIEPPPYIRSVHGRPSEEEWNAMAVAH